jgi:hypothetical protein
MSPGRGHPYLPLRGTLGTVVRTALEQLDVVQRQARSQRDRLDRVLAERRHREALAELGEIVLELVAAGELAPDEHPALRDAVDRAQESAAALAPATPPPRPARAATGPVRVWRPPSARAEAETEHRAVRVWQTDASQDRSPGALQPSSEMTAAPGAAPPRRAARGRAGGGIDFPAAAAATPAPLTFDDDGGPPHDRDEELEEFMHEGDLPRDSAGHRDD